MKPILEVKGIGKRYDFSPNQGSNYQSIRDGLSSLFTRKKNQEKFWALKDINFSLQEGETLGIIGRNGAGKSTLLKIISKITYPTCGEVISRGRVASLLEVGTGFHPELTGRENIFLNGSILGLKKQEVTKKIDEIIDFSGVEKFIDTPLKYYSTGMRLRLAFSVAAHLEPEILIIDEVLAVGDARFQKKCLYKMGEVSQSGRTILFVSHQLESLQKLCSKSIRLEQGELVDSGSTGLVVAKYLSDSLSGPENILSAKYYDKRNIEIETFCLLGEEEEKRIFEIDDQIQGLCKYKILSSGKNISFSCVVNTFDGRRVLTHICHNFGTINEKGTYTTSFFLPKALLNEGKFTVGISLIDLETKTIYFQHYDYLTFEIIEIERDKTKWGNYQGPWAGITRPKVFWEHQKNQ